MLFSFSLGKRQRSARRGIGQNSPLTEHLTADEVGTATAFLCSPLASGITGTTLYVDKGYHSMGMAVEQ